MYEEEDRRLFDEIYQLWASTTWAKNRYWMPVEYVDGTGRFKLYAVDPETDEKTLIASELQEYDAEFIAGLHGAIPDLVRRLHDAVDEAVRADERRDELENQLADLELENHGLKEEIVGLERQLG